jgi:hypothetical protein
MDNLLTCAYEILDVPEDAAMEQVTRAYHALIHDKTGDWEQIKEIDRAYEIIIAHLTPVATGSQPEPAPHRRPAPAAPAESLAGVVKNLLYPPALSVNPFVFGARAFFFLIILVWGATFIFAPVQGDSPGRSFMRLVNLPFHEAGHVIFSFLGDFVRVLGGTAMQILIPLVCMGALLKKGDPFGASFALWWAGQNFIDVSPYIYDARAGELTLLGGITGQEAPDFHDWRNMLGRSGLLPYDHVVAYLAKYTGVFLMLLSSIWGALTLLRQYRNLKRG